MATFRFDPRCEKERERSCFFSYVLRPFSLADRSDRNGGHIPSYVFCVYSLFYHLAQTDLKWDGNVLLRNAKERRND